ncbi:LysR family transcriptional regulator [Agrobacterium genomosp. 3]|jgi:DNA-binding transcriptional LysR family regulator|uniref:LysR family transcriptional regulator n=1 Tax=Agrobacterium TaxID=357 RepID=UPI0011D7CAE4|nr:LysR family transcriptional regulator [Agrobacterium pusense]MCA1867983.1 LysR family transcriptional regulator [Agrobacterium tomkonis]MCA1878324.1 LysR family transcriptional regulator [Agrobacterium tumefaciens]TXI00713.1 MAG: LysR family transcriptional regulator [Rhizobium sp.]MCA1893558.1 LysR family transcriptional regulator [Agrobacterium tomkonis]MDH0117090.1 LysR family transcriptional regulator [Agrobacterium pusense]
MDNRAGEMMVFVRVVEAGSFSEAARLMLMTPSTVSKLIARLESRLGVRLIERSTRRLALTEEGQFYYERSQALLSQLDETEQQIAQGGAEAEGVVRVTSSVSFGTTAVEPILPAFFEAYPNVIVDLSLSDDVVDLYLDRTDIAIRVGKLADSNLMARKIGETKRCIVASPAYLERHGTPTAPEELVNHNCLGFNFRRAMPVWPMREGGRIVERMLSGSLLVNNGDTLRRMAIAGVGIIRLADYHLRGPIERGELVELLSDSDIGVVDEVHALYRGSQFLPARVRAFLDFTVPRMQKFLQ